MKEKEENPSKNEMKNIFCHSQYLKNHTRRIIRDSWSLCELISQLVKDFWVLEILLFSFFCFSAIFHFRFAIKMYLSQLNKTGLQTINKFEKNKKLSVTYSCKLIYFFGLLVGSGGKQSSANQVCCLRMKQPFFNRFFQIIVRSIPPGICLQTYIFLTCVYLWAKSMQLKRTLNSEGLAI